LNRLVRLEFIQRVVLPFQFLLGEQFMQLAVTWTTKVYLLVPFLAMISLHCLVVSSPRNQMVPGELQPIKLAKFTNHFILFNCPYTKVPMRIDKLVDPVPPDAPPGGSYR
jgi:hypothetical protein